MVAQNVAHENRIIDYQYPYRHNANLSPERFRIVPAIVHRESLIYRFKQLAGHR
jgi:hypothetical protein